MADTGWKSPGTVVSDNSVGTIAWSNPDYVKSDDENYAYVVFGSMASAAFKVVKLVVGGSVSGNNKEDSSYITWSEKTYGGSLDTWGLTLSSSDINSSSFGVVFQGTDITMGYGDTEYLKAINFGFNIPSGADIDGIEVKSILEEAGEHIYFDHIQIKVYYTENNSTPIIGQKYALPPFRRS